VVVNETAIPVRPLVKVPDRRAAEMREAVTKFFQILIVQSLGLFTIRSPCHEERD
jgi:hypothetical protein